MKMWHYVAVGMAVALLPTVVQLLTGLAPPWPSGYGMAACAGAVSTAVAALLLQGWTVAARRLPRTPRARFLFFRLPAAGFVVLFLAYVTADSMLCWSDPPQLSYRERVVGGLVKRSDVRQLLEDRSQPITPTLVGLLRDAGYEPDEIWEAWSISAVRDILVSLWVSVWLVLAVPVAYLVAIRASRKVLPFEASVVRAGQAVAQDGLEKTIRARLGAFDFAVFREKMALVERRVCRVELDGNAAGTGFLVGPDAVLTNYHVLEAVLRGKTPPQKVTCRFDYKVLVDQSRVEGVAVGLHPTDWKVDYSPCSPAEQTSHPDNPPPTPDELDYALVRLARPLGDGPAAFGEGGEGPQRGWLTMSGSAPVFVPKMPLMIAQHPDGKPLKLAVDTESVLGVNAGGTRVRYATNTEAGSSGSPVFDLEWNLVALHHLGDPAYDHPAAYNQGVPIDRIRNRIAANGKSAVLGGPA